MSIALLASSGLLCAGGCGTATARGPKQAIASRGDRPGGSWYRVDAAKNLTEVAQQTGAPLALLEELNGLDRQRKLSRGQLLFLPDGRVNRVLRKRTRGEPRPPLDWLWPVNRGQLSSRFGVRSGTPHEGIDISAAEGTAIVAAERGEVVYAGDDVSGYGNMIIVRHPGPYVTVYAHNRRNLVQRGTRIERGQVIAEVGDTGKARGHHLHFELRNGDKPLDPLTFISPP